MNVLLHAATDSPASLNMEAAVATLSAEFDRANVTVNALTDKLFSTGQPDDRLAPAKLLARLTALEAELPELRKQLTAHRDATRAALGSLQATIVNNQRAAQALSERVGSGDGATAVHAPPPVPAAAAAAAPAASATLSELEWLKIPAAERKGLAFGDLSEFWTKLKGLFEKREATELQAAQLLALGVRIMDAGDRKKLALLEKLGHVALANNAVKLR